MCYQFAVIEKIFENNSRCFGARLYANDCQLACSTGKGYETSEKICTTVGCTFDPILLQT
jgi:hypothetical protein